jgi:sialate O-acetylesterase
MKPALALVALFTFQPSLLHADVTLNPMFGDHMVLQRERPLPVWGRGDPGEKVVVSFAGKTQQAVTGNDGKWMVTFEPLAVSTEPRVLTVKGKNSISVSDVLVGDVWLGSGQSNMDFKVANTEGSEAIKKMPAGAFNGIRLFIVAQATADEPRKEIAGGSWQEPSTANIMEFSATLFYFGGELQKRLPGVPLGLVRSSVGATNLYSWVPNEVRDKDASADYLRTWWAKETRNWTAEKQAVRNRELADYKAKVEDYKKRGEKLPADVKEPGELTGPEWSRRPSGLYNGMIAPLQPLALRGMIWYQGEWDCKADWSRNYHDLFVAFAKGWRGQWAKAAGRESSGNFPIYIVQLPAREDKDQNGKFWPFLREAQQRAATSVPNSGYVVTFDTNDPTDMHPRAKTPVGQRLAWLALGREYRQKLPWHGPEMKAARAGQGGVLVEFDSGSESIASKDGQPLRWFEIAGGDGVYHPATAQIRGGNQVFVSSSEVTNPATVRYAFVPNAEKPNFYNSAGLPAGPFRTDQQPVPQK